MWMTELVTFSHPIHALRASVLLVGCCASVATAQEPAVPPEPRAEGAPSGLRLDEVLQRALAQNPLLEAARARVSAARGVRRTARALPNPVLTYWVESLGAPWRSASTSLDRETQTYATLPLEPLFQRSPRVRGADATVRAADAELARARQVVALDAARAFYRVAAAQDAVEAADEILARLTELVTFNQVRVEEGVAAEADLIRTQLERDRMAAIVTLEQVELSRARAALAPYVATSATGATQIRDRAAAPRSDALRVTVDDSADAPLPEILSPVSDFVAQARLARPDLLASRARAEAARAEVTYQRTLTVRQIGATVGTKRTAGVTSLIAGVTLPIPLFDQNRGEVQRAAGERTATEQELAWAERQVSAEVEAAYEAVRLLTMQANRLRGSFLSRAEESRRIALAAYQEGAVSLLQVLDASRALADARLTYYRTVFAQRQSLLEFRAATGASLLNGRARPSASTSDASSRSTPGGETLGRTCLTRTADPSLALPIPSNSSRPMRPSGDRR